MTCQCQPEVPQQGASAKMQRAASGAGCGASGWHPKGVATGIRPLCCALSTYSRHAFENAPRARTPVATLTRRFNLDRALARLRPSRRVRPWRRGVRRLRACPPVRRRPWKRGRRARVRTRVNARERPRTHRGWPPRSQPNTHSPRTHAQNVARPRRRGPLRFAQRGRKLTACARRAARAAEVGVASFFLGRVLGVLARAQEILAVAGGVDDARVRRAHRHHPDQHRGADDLHHLLKARRCALSGAFAVCFAKLSAWGKETW